MAVAAADARPGLSLRDRLARAEQGFFVLVITVVLCVAGALTTEGFLTGGNFASLLRLSAAFGILAIGLAIVILGKGIDLSVAGVALGCAQATLAFMSGGMSEWQAILLMAGLALVIGVVNGLLVAYLEVPALFATLATGLLTIGGVDIFLLDQNFYALPPGSAISALSNGSVLGVPRPVLIAAAVFLLAWLFVTFTAPGRLIRAMGDNFATARSTGAPVRPLQMLTYVLSALLALLAGYVTVSIQGSVQTTVTSFDPLLFTALTVTVIGGVSLSGGRGTILGVLAGALFVGVLNNLLILHGLSTAMQDLVRGGVLIAAIALDAWLHPRDEETAKTDEL
ncbi:ABC transporter permease [Amycolatopsis thermophila]|uniref:ABC transporter permease n=2 Tax=Amycolatopsis TaxID=1813 RepID=A0ABQ3ITM1_9PSEU|nr:ABC transporter permease [Amycolatopsis thermophila]MDQ0382527.1 ribose transport system permease protein [Amycolatopsis thermophila]GHE93778.1 ABC transporter permease [Amycolatopsis deserti]